MNIYQHFRPSEREFIDQVLQWKQEAEDFYQMKVTNFLDPREQFIMESIIGKNGDVKVSFFGGFQGAERKRGMIYPPFIPIHEEDFAIQIFEMIYPKKFVTLTHRHVLGSLMGLGVKRSKFGDIIFQNDRIQFAVCKEIAEYLTIEFHSVGKYSVRLENVSKEKTFVNQEKWQEEGITVSSLRLDTIISAIYRMSRQKAQDLIKHGLVKVNWAVIEDVAYPLESLDVLSIRGYGRSKVIEIEGKTKKDKWRLTIGKLQ